MGNEINRDSAVYFDSEVRVVPARLARGNSRDAAPEALSRRGNECLLRLSRCCNFSRGADFIEGLIFIYLDIFFPLSITENFDRFYLNFIAEFLFKYVRFTLNTFVS